MKLPSAAAVVVAVVVAKFLSVFVAPTTIRFPGTDVPVTVTGEPLTDDRSAGLVTVRLVVPCVCAT